tara:strand:- start:387 stop:1994 length:1608 start_codon:yes stop_codon:yes gene_type:complete
MTREEKIKALRRHDKIAKLRAHDEQQGMAAATKMADQGGDQEGVEASTLDKFRATIGGAKLGGSAGLADKLDLPGDYVADIAQGETFGTTTDTRRAQEAAVKAKAPGYHMAGDIAAGVAMPLGSLKRAGQGVLGGIEAAGRSEDLFSAQGLQDVGIGAAGGYALGAGGELLGKGAQKLGKAIKKAPDKVPTGAQIREGAMHKTPTKRRNEQQFPKEKLKNKEAVKTGEKHGIFKGSSLDELVPKTQAKLQEIGSELGNTAKESAAALGPMAKYTKEPALKAAQKSYDKGVAAIKKKTASGAFDNAEGARALKMYDEEFTRLADMVKTRGTALEAIRELKTNIYNRMNSADFQFGGPKAGTPKDVLRDITTKLQEMEKGALRNTETLLKMRVPKGTSRLNTPEATKGAKRLVDTHLDNLKDFGDLKKLEGQLAVTVDKQVGNLGLKEITAGSVGATVDPLVGVATASAQAASKKLSTPKGQFWLAKVADAYNKNPSKGPKLAQAMANLLGVPIEAVGDALRQSGKLIPAAAAATDK